MSKLLDALKREATEYEVGHGAFGERETWSHLNPELFAELVVDYCMDVAEKVLTDPEGIVLLKAELASRFEFDED